MTLSVTFEWLCGGAAILRLHEHPDARFGDPYVWWTVVKVHGHTAELKGADRPLPRGGARAVCSALKAVGFLGRRHDRLRRGTVRTVTREL